jgi:hypothetical protein
MPIGATFASVASARYKIIGKTAFINIQGLEVSLSAPTPAFQISNIYINGRNFSSNTHYGSAYHTEETDVIIAAGVYSAGQNRISFGRGDASNFPSGTNTIGASLIIELA